MIESRSVINLEASSITAQQSHPKSLYLLFFTELWERFGFYTLQTILILYLTKSLLFRDQQANALYAAFSALLYLTPVLGGYLADKYLGFQRAIVIGGLLFIVGYLLCATNDSTIFFIGLAILICANGLFKPNVSSIVGELYGENDPRREGGFTIFYMGINIGALIPPLIAGALVVTYGWHAGFLLAAAGMAIGQIIFQLGKKQLGSAGLHPSKSASVNCGVGFYSIFAIGLITTIALCKLAFTYPDETSLLVEFSTIGIFLLVLFYVFKEPLAQRKKMFAALVLTIISFAFWALYNQAFTSLMLFSDRNMEQQFLGMPFNAYATQFFNPFFIILLSPLLSRFWLKLDDVGLNPSTQLKFFLGVFAMSAGYLLLALGTEFFAQDGLLPAWWIGASYLLQTFGELLISPIGLAMITVLSPKHLVGMMMGVWFFAQAASFAVGGYLANIAAVPSNLDPVASLPIYNHAFTIYGLICLIMAFVSLACVPILNKALRAT